MRLFEPTDLSGGERVARVTQGLVLYFETDWADFWPAFVSTLGVFLREPWAGALTCIRRWNEQAWQPWSVERAPELLAALQLRGPVPYSKLELADKPVLPEVGIDWQVLPQAQGSYPRAGYVRVRLPLEAPVLDLLGATSLLAQALPVQQGRAGYVCEVDENNRKIGFDQAWVWARRYYGMDVFDSVEETWDATKGLLGVNWLTIVGERWMKGPLKDVPLEDRSGVVRVSKTPHGGVVLQAGTNPTIGDHNRVQDVSALALASKILEPALIEAPTGLPGMFDDHQSTLLWIRRFLDPQAWHENA